MMKEAFEQLVREIAEEMNISEAEAMERLKDVVKNYEAAEAEKR